MEGNYESVFGHFTLYTLLDVACYAVTSTFGEAGIDPLHALIDNINIERSSGFMLIIR